MGFQDTALGVKAFHKKLSVQTVIRVQCFWGLYLLVFELLAVAVSVPFKAGKRSWGFTWGDVQ